MNPETLRNFIVNGNIAFKEGATSFIFSCPRCNKNNKLYIHKQHGRFICFVCKDRSKFYGKAEYALSELYNLSVSDVQYRLYGQADKQFKKYIDFTLKDLFDYNVIEEEPEINEIYYPPDFISLNMGIAKPGANYLLGRGLTQDHFDTYHLMYHPAWRTVVFPIKYQGKLYGWQERSIDTKFKYTNKGFKKDQMLMFQDRLDYSNKAVLTEGPVDALKCHVLNIGNVASMGKAVSNKQLNIIKSKCNTLYIGLDPDADTEIDKICRNLYDSFTIYLLLPPTGRKDLGECSEEEVIEQFNKAQKYCGQLFFSVSI
jgi:hypothetical protein